MSNKINVVGNRHRLTRSGNYFKLNEQKKQISGNQGYNLEVLLDRNEDLKNNAEIIEIDWEATFISHQKRIKARPEEKILSIEEFKEQVLSALKDETKREKLLLELPTSESYLEMKRLGGLKPEKVKDYIGWLETQVVALTEFEIHIKMHESESKKDESSESDELKGLQSEYKNLKGEDPDKRWKEPRLKEEISKLQTQPI